MAKKRFRLPKRPGEEWLEAYPGYYLSNLGRWYSYHFKKLIKQFPNDSGYLRATIRIGEERKHVFTHIKVVEFFGDKNGQTIKHLNSLGENKLSIDHLDCDKTNNAFSNLELVTHQENCRRRDERIEQKRIEESKVTWYVTTVKLPRQTLYFCRTDKESSDCIDKFYKAKYPKSEVTTVILDRLPKLKQSDDYTLIVDYRAESADLTTCSDIAALKKQMEGISYLWPKAMVRIEAASVVV